MADVYEWCRSAIGKDGNDAVGVEEARNDAIFPFWHQQIDILGQPMVPVDGHAVAVRSNAAGHGGIISVHKAAVPRKYPILSKCPQESNARLPVLKLVE